MNLSYAPIVPEKEEIVLPRPIQHQVKPAKDSSSPPQREEGTECNYLLIFFIIGLIYIINT